MTWSSLLLAGVPYLVFDTLEKQAYSDYFGEEKTEDSPETREHFDYNVEIWEMMAAINVVTWGPLFVLGVFNLSEFMGGLSAFYIEYIWSNLYFPAYLAGFYLMTSNAIQGQTRLDGWAFSSFLVVSFASFWGQGFALQEMLTEISDYDINKQPWIWPSIWRLLGWVIVK